MKYSLEQESTGAAILIMGETGTGKSSFINLLTDDDKIHVGHTQQSETFGIQIAHFIDPATTRSVMLIDTPGFDDSRERITDTDLLEDLVRFLDPRSGERISITGIIYMHRISDPRVSGVSRRNLKMFHALCGEKNLANVRIVTTNWSRVTEEEGSHRADDLARGVFRPLIDAGAEMRRHENTRETAHGIVAELMSLHSVTLAIQEEASAGKRLMDTGAGKVLTERMQEMTKKHEQELAALEKEINDAEEKKSCSLIAELEQERKALQEKMDRINGDRKKLESILGAVHGITAGEQENPARLRESNEDACGVSEIVQVRLENPMNAEPRAANQSFDLGEECGTEYDDAALFAREEFLRTRLDELRTQEGLAAERRFRELKTVEARIGHAETRRDVWDQVPKLLRERFNSLYDGCMRYLEHYSCTVGRPEAVTPGEPQGQRASGEEWEWDEEPLEEPHIPRNGA